MKQDGYEETSASATILVKLRRCAGHSVRNERDPVTRTCARPACAGRSAGAAWHNADLPRGGTRKHVLILAQSVCPASFCFVCFQRPVGAIHRAAEERGRAARIFPDRATRHLDRSPRPMPGCAYDRTSLPLYPRCLSADFPANGAGNAWAARERIIRWSCARMGQSIGRTSSERVARCRPESPVARGHVRFRAGT